MKRRRKVASMVPSWTETLLACGADVVARTRFCIHPESQVRVITAVGGTKDISWEKLRATGAELLVLDREENPRSFADDAPIATHASHVTSILSLIDELEALAAVFEASATQGYEGDRDVAGTLRDLARRWRRVHSRPNPSDRVLVQLPSVREWIKSPEHQATGAQIPAVYVIWKNAKTDSNEESLMGVGAGTFIHSMLELFGLENRLAQAPFSPALYPTFSLAQIPDPTLFLFSSEPFPFHRHVDWIRSQGRLAAIVDGEKWSWFGVRALEFCERSLECTQD